MSIGNVGAIKNLLDGVIYSEYKSSRASQGLSLAPWMILQVLSRADLASSKNAKISLPITNASAVNATTGSSSDLVAVIIDNNDTVDTWVQVFNTAGGSVTLGTTAPRNSFYCETGKDKVYILTEPVTHGTALSWDATTTMTGSGRSGSGLVKVSLVYVQ